MPINWVGYSLSIWCETWTKMQLNESTCPLFRHRPINNDNYKYPYAANIPKNNKSTDTQKHYFAHWNSTAVSLRTDTHTHRHKYLQLRAKSSSLGSANAHWVGAKCINTTADRCYDFIRVLTSSAVSTDQQIGRKCSPRQPTCPSEVLCVKSHSCRMNWQRNSSSRGDDEKRRPSVHEFHWWR